MLIIIGKDPSDPRRWIVKCPGCQQIRSLSYNGYRDCLERNHSLCPRCSRVKSVPNTDELILVGLDPDHVGYWIAQCPDCRQARSISSFSKYRAVKSGDSRCGSCACKQAKDITGKNTTDYIVLGHDLDNPSKRYIVQCPGCKVTRSVDRSIVTTRKTYCRSCAGQGPKHHRWLGGNAVNKRKYQRADWDKVRQEIRERDNVCQFPECGRICSQDGRALSVHHIDPLRNHDSHEPLNLVALCTEHHAWADQHLDESIPMLKNLVAMKYS